MSFDEGLAERIREQLQDRSDVEEKKMFGGLCFMVSNHMCCGIVKDTLMARVGPDNYEGCLAEKHASEMDFTGKAMNPSNVFDLWIGVSGYAYYEPDSAHMFQGDIDDVGLYNRALS